MKPVSQGPKQVVPGLPLQAPELVGLMREVLARGASFRFDVSGASMFPFIRGADIVTVAPVQAATLNLGDVVASEHPGSGRLIVHRIVKRQREQCVLRGDNVCRDDGTVAATAILGKVIAVERQGTPVRLGLGGGRFLIAMLSRLGILVLFWRCLRACVRPFRKRVGASLE